MYLRAGVFSLGLLLLSRFLGLARESAQAAAFGSTGMGDVVILMFTLPDLLVGIFLSGGLAYVLLPVWAQQDEAERNAAQAKTARVLLAGGAVCGLAIWALQNALAQALAPGLAGTMRDLGASSLLWSALVLPMAMLAALWATRLQHERDFVGMYAGNLLVNAVLVGALLLVVSPFARLAGQHMIAALGLCLAAGMLGRLGWLAWRLRGGSKKVSGRPAPVGDANSKAAGLPGASVWAWAAMSSGLLLLLPLVARSIASQAGEGALSTFNYAWKLVELPLVLAVQLVASLAFPAITRTEAGSQARNDALRMALLLAWTLACAAVAVVATFSFQLAGLLFGWGRMSAEKLTLIAQWSAAGIWSLLPQAVIAVLLTAMAISRRMHVAVYAYVLGLLVLGIFAWAAATARFADYSGMGVAVMYLLDAVLAGVALILLVSERNSLARAVPWKACALPLLICIVLVGMKPIFAGLGLAPAMLASCVYGLLVIAGGMFASGPLRGMIQQKLRRPLPVAKA